MNYLLTTLLSFSSLLSFSQNKQDTIYFDKSWTVTNIMDSAAFYRIVEEADGLYQVRDYYIETDTLQMTGAFKDSEQKIKEGPFVYYNRIGGFSSKEAYRNGKLYGERVYYSDAGKVSSIENYEDGVLHGDFIIYYANGVVKRKERYEHGYVTTKACYLEDGQETIYYPYDVPASYPGGMEAIKQYLKDNLKYPREAVKNKIEGKIYIQFVISDKGEVTLVKVKKGVHPLLDEEAVRIVKSMPKWNPGMIDGKPVNSVFSLPISFRL